MILVIDNYDSFTYNLVQYIGTLADGLTVYRNDKITLEEIREMAPEKIVISPGPGRPEDAGISVDLVRSFGETTPVLGICLGHQVAAQAYGGTIVHAPTIFHGKTSLITHNGDSLFTDVPKTIQGTRYHSLVVDRATFPSSMRITAETEDGTIMGLTHQSHPVKGVQFHPESIVTEHGMQIIRNFIERES